MRAPVTERLNATAALGRVASEHPDAGLDAVDDLIELLDSDTRRVRANASGVLSDVAVVHSGSLVPHIDELEPLLYSDATSRSISRARREGETGSHEDVDRRRQDEADGS